MTYAVSTYFISAFISLSADNSSDPDKAQQNIGTDLEANCLTFSDGALERNFRKKVNFG